MQLGLEDKIDKCLETIEEAYLRFPLGHMAVAFTGGKDSTLLLWLVREHAQSQNRGLPKAIFINEGHLFDEVRQFVERIGSEWNLDLHEARNDDVLKQVQGVGDVVSVAALNDRNRAELDRLGFAEESFPFEPESYVGNHLMKTVAMNLWLEETDTRALMTGIRWDEQVARAAETYFSERRDPDHTRVHPILHLSERDVWQATHSLGIPFVELYRQGYRSLGAKHTTTKISDLPAWEQDLDGTAERSGRRQDKEGIMDRLRELGYM
jgi:phosphoadenosine phosphosulfate reductase